MVLNFKDWLEMQESGTSTACIAGFSRIVMPLITRQWPTLLKDDDDEEEHHHKKKKSKKKKSS